jgi:hypothetical protein
MTWRAETANKSRTIQITVNSRDGQTTLQHDGDRHDRP